MEVAFVHFKYKQTFRGALPVKACGSKVLGGDYTTFLDENLEAWITD